MKGLHASSMNLSEKVTMDAVFDDKSTQQSMNGRSTILSMDGLGPELSREGDLGFSQTQGEVDGCSPLGWPLGRRDRANAESSPSKLNSGRDAFMWEEKREKRETELSEVEMMKERFAKLLLGEDMSGGAKGVCTALAISNAITNLSASVFGELWRLEPLAPERSKMWRRDMEWLLSVSDHIVELVPSWQTYPDGSTLEVMVSKPRSDLHINLPALRKLDTMLLDSLDHFSDTEFWYVDRGIALTENDNRGGLRHSLQRQEEKWWLPTPKVPVNGLSDESRKRLRYQRECTSQILKAAMAINGQVLSEMEVPEIYWDSLPKNGKSSLGEALYRGLVSENFSAEGLLSTLDTSNERSAVELANRLETAILVWHRKIHTKQMQSLPEDSRFTAKSSWGMMKDLVGEVERKEVLADKAESLLLCLKQRFPGLAQTALDTHKIQYNRDVGQSILESYSRVLESLAFNIIARIDDVLYADNLVSRFLASPVVPVREQGVARHGLSSTLKRSKSPFTMHLTAVSTSYATASVSPRTSPTPSPNHTPNSPRDSTKGTLILGSSLGKALSEYMHGEAPEGETRLDPEGLVKFPLEAIKTWTYAGNLESSNALHSPPGRD